MNEKKMSEKQFKPKTGYIMVLSCLENCVWRSTKYTCGCCMYTDISACVGKQSVEEAKAKKLI